MNSVSRQLTLGMIVALGAAACGDDVTVTEQTPPPAPTPVVRSVVVSPSAATIAAGVARAGSKTTVASFVSRLTLALSTPGTSSRACCTWPWQAEQVMPPTGMVSVFTATLGPGSQPF